MYMSQAALSWQENRREGTRPHQRNSNDQSTGVYSWNTYPTSLFICTPVILCNCVIELLSVTTMCDFERGGAKKPILGSSWNNSEKNCLDLYQIQKRSNVILLMVLCWVYITSLNALATLLEVLLIFSFANRHTDTKALLYPCYACTCRIKIKEYQDGGVQAC